MSTLLFLLPCAQEATFSLGDRISVLDQLDKPAIIPHMAEYEGRKFPYEVREGQGTGTGGGRKKTKH